MKDTMKEQKKNLSKYILPAMLSNASFFILTIVDGMFVGNGVGTNALGAVSLAMPYVMIVGAIAVLFSIGGVAVAAVRLGRGDVKGANQVFMHSFTAVVAIFGLLTILGTTCAKGIATLLGANDTYRDMVADYVFWYSVFAIPSGLYTCLASYCRNDGAPSLCSVTAVICVTVNILADYIAVFPLQKGIAGAAFATGFSSLVAICVLLSHFLRKKGQLRFQRFTPKISLLKKIVIRGLPEMVSQFAAPITTYSMNRMLLGFLGDTAVNAYSVIGYAGSLFASLMYGLAGGMQPLYGLSYGARDDRSLKFYFRSGLTMAAIGGLAAFGLTFFIGGPVCTLFGADAEAHALVVNALPKYCLNYVFAMNSAVLASYLFSTKRTQYALILNICRSLVFNFLCINFLPLIFGSEFIWFTVAVAEGCCLVIGITLWRMSEKNGILYK